MSEDERKSTILEHLGELRRRLTRSVIAVVITTVISFTFYKQIFEILLSRTQGITLIYVEMTEMISVVMRVCLASGIILAMPYLTYEFVLFVSPALTRKEKR
ncbi:MAG: twin-arginine translocase subunit TatC, partial [Chloroflexi bacterium]|nr:twin-arginine translocase subunit TatC [Chloroflexota bacterium]